MKELKENEILANIERLRKNQRWMLKKGDLWGNETTLCEILGFYNDDEKIEYNKKDPVYPNGKVCIDSTDYFLCNYNKVKKVEPEPVKYYTWNEAVELMKAGKKVSRKIWVAPLYIYMREDDRGGLLMNELDEATNFYIGYLDCNDWVVVEEDKQPELQPQKTTGLTWAEAVEAMKVGKKVTNHEINKIRDLCSHYYMDNTLVMDSNGYTMDIKQLSKFNDWEIVD